MAEVRNCRRCNKIFTYSGNSFCPNCRTIDQNDFKKIRDYLFMHPNSSALEVSEATGIKVTQILTYLKDGLLESDLPGGSGGDNFSNNPKPSGNFATDSDSNVKSTAVPTCDICGRPTKGGKCGICEKVY